VAEAERRGLAEMARERLAEKARAPAPRNSLPAAQQFTLERPAPVGHGFPYSGSRGGVLDALPDPVLGRGLR
jgi:hypothetical protein